MSDCLVFTKNEAAYLLAKIDRDIQKWNRRLINAETHGAIEQRERIGASINRLQVLRNRIEASS